MDEDDPVKDAAREIAAAARAVATGVAVAARARAERETSRASQEARRLEVRSRAAGAWRGVEGRRRPHDVEAALGERRRREAQREQEMAL